MNKCEICEKLYECEEKPETSCEDCREEFACVFCGKADLKTLYCKYTDQIYHDECNPI